MKNVSESKILQKKKFVSDFKQSFYHENLKSQRIAATILCTLMFIFGIVWLINGIFFQKAVDKLVGFVFPSFPLSFFLLSFSAYEGLLVFLFQKTIKGKRTIAEGYKFLNAFIETSFVTGLLFLLAQYFPTGDLILNSPGIFLYFLFIILSILKLRFTISMFTGFLSSAGYLALFHYLTEYAKFNTETAHYLYSLAPTISKAIFIFIAGGLAGFVAKQLNKRISNSLENLTNRNYIANLFGQYISPVIAERLIAQKAEFQPELRHVCVMFFDIRNFTMYSEKHSPKEVIEFLNTFFMPLIEIINKNHGFINKFLGDGFMAVFGAPLPDGLDRVHAAQAAFEIISKIQAMNDQKAIPRTEFGIGLHSGPAMTGNVGSEERKEYTVIGDTVNIASRVEQLNKKYNSKFIATDVVYSAIKNEHQALSEETVEIRGKDQSLKIYILA